MRKIIHIDMDAFYASIEQRDCPELRGRPIAVGHEGPRGVVATASYEARRYGVHSAMSSLRARRLCPELIFVATRMEVYKSVSRQIHAIFHDYTSLVEPLSLDEAFLDVSHMPSATLLAQEIKARIREETGLTASAGVSVNKMLAKIASDYRKPDGLFVIPPKEIAAFVAGLPIEKFFGIGEVTARKMHRLGIRTGADLRQWSEPDLVRYFRRSLSGGKGLIPVVGHHAALLAETLFDRDHLVAGCHGGAVYAGNKPLHDFRTLVVRFGFLRLFLLYRVFDHVGKSLRFPQRHIRFLIKGGVFRLIGIFHIHNELSEPAMHPPN